MNEEQKLKLLKDIQVDPSDKEEAYSRVAQRLNRKKFHWQVPAVCIGMLCIIFFLIVSQPVMQPLQASDVTSISAAYKISDEGNPTSKWQLGVKELHDQEQLTAIQHNVGLLVPIAEPIGEIDVLESINLVYSDGTRALWQELYVDSAPYFYNATKQQYYTLPSDQELYMSDIFHFPYKDKSFLLGMMLLFITSTMLIQWYTERKMKKVEPEHGEGKRYSTKWQMAVNLTLVAVLMGSIFFITQLHFLVVIAYILISLCLMLWLENRYGQNNWRKLGFFIEAVYQIFLTYFIFMNFS